MKYPKIDTIWKRDENDKYNIIDGDYSKEEFPNIKRWDVSEKIDGTNIRVIYDRELNEVEFWGRTDKSEIPKFLLQYLKDTFLPVNLKPIFTDVRTVILFGEGYGGRIQKAGKKYREDVALILFDVWVDEWWLAQDDVRDIGNNLGVETVPHIGCLTIEEAVDYIKSKPRSIISKEEMVAEGIVARSSPLMLFRNGDPILWKLKVNDYTRLENRIRK